MENSNNNFNVSEIMNLLSKMSKEDIEKNISQASKFLSEKDTTFLINQMNKMNKDKN